MDVPAETVGIILLVAALGVTILIIAFFAYHSGAPNLLNYILGFFR